MYSIYGKMYKDCHKDRKKENNVHEEYMNKGIIACFNEAEVEIHITARATQLTQVN